MSSKLEANNSFLWTMCFFWAICCFVGVAFGSGALVFHLLEPTYTREVASGWGIATGFLCPLILCTIGALVHRVWAGYKDQIAELQYQRDGERRNKQYAESEASAQVGYARSRLADGDIEAADDYLAKWERR